MNLQGSGIVISAMPGAGKSTFMRDAEEKGIMVSDSDSQNHSFLTDENGQYIDIAGNIVTDKNDRVKNPNFISDYISAIKDAVNSNAVVFVAAHSEVRAALNKESIPFSYICYEDGLKDEVVNRIKTRKGSQPESVNNIIANVVDQNWEQWLEETNVGNPVKKIVLGSNQFIGNILEFRDGNIELRDKE